MRVCNCQFQCREIEHDDMLQMFKEFYKLDYNGQTTHLAELCLKVVEVNRRRVSECTSKRQCTIQYFVKIDDSSVRICKKTLCHIYQITPRRIQML